MLGELLYERGELDEAERLLDEGYKLGPEGGSVDFKIARYVMVPGSSCSVAIGRQRSKGSTRPRVARALSLNRLRAMVENERIRLGLPPLEFGAPGDVLPRAPPAGGRDRRDHRAI